DPPGNYQINYKAILAWIKANCVQATTTDPKPFPPLMRAGNILYYDSIPDDVPASAYDHTQPNNAITDANTRFWKEYIDFTLGVWRDPYGVVQRPIGQDGGAGGPSKGSACSFGPDFVAGTGQSGQDVHISGPDK